MSPFATPPGYNRIRVVRSFHELLATPLRGGLNALCWERTLSGDFDEVVESIGVSDGVTTLDDSRLKALSLSAAGRTAVDVLLGDQRLLREQGLSPVLDCVHAYPRDDSRIVPTDVHSFHVDSAPAAIDTYLCSYTGAASEGLRNDEAKRRVDIPETRAALLRDFGGVDDDAFLAHLKETCRDLHYAQIPGARPFSFGLGNLWRLAVDYPGSPVPPFIHRAPEPVEGQARLLLIS